MKKYLVTGIWISALRAAGAALVFLYVWLLTNSLSVDDYGAFALFMAILGLLSVFARYGGDLLILKYVGRNMNMAASYLYSIYYISLFSVAMFVTLAFFLGVSFTKLKILESGSFLILPMVFLYLASESLKVLGWQGLAAFLQACLMPFIFILILLFMGEADIGLIVKAYSFALALSCIVAFIVSVILYGKGRVLPRSTVMEMAIEGWSLMLVTSTVMLMAWVDILMLGWLSSSENVAVYSIASKLASIFSILSVSVVSLLSSKFSILFSEGRIEELYILFQKVTRFLIFFSMSLFILLYIFSDFVLSFFGAIYVKEGRSLMLILAGAQLFVLAFSPSSILLSMTDKQVLLRKINVVALLLNIFLAYILYQYYEVTGVALSTLISVIIWRVLILIGVKRSFYVEKY